MAYDDNKCVCGGKKCNDTLICADCVTKFESTPEWSIFKNSLLLAETRRRAAIYLLARARRRRNLMMPNA